MLSRLLGGQRRAVREGGVEREEKNGRDGVMGEKGVEG